MVIARLPQDSDREDGCGISGRTIKDRNPPQTDVYTLIRTRLLNNEILPGARVGIEGLARDLAVSATRVREALSRLEGDDLVIKDPNRGWKATELLSKTQLQELFQFRLLIEPWAAEFAATAELGNPAERLQSEIADFMARSSRLKGGRQRLIEHDTRFHHLILSATGNATITHAFDRTHCHLHLFRLREPVDSSGQQSLAEHQKISTAIQDRNPAEAADAMRQHLTAGYQRFAETFSP